MVVVAACLRGGTAAGRQVHWLRVILDEGHLVSSSALTNKLVAGTNLRAERRCARARTPAADGGARARRPSPTGTPARLTNMAAPALTAGLLLAAGECQQWLPNGPLNLSAMSVASRL